MSLVPNHLIKKKADGLKMMNPQGFIAQQPMQSIANMVGSIQHLNIQNIENNMLGYPEVEGRDMANPNDVTTSWSMPKNELIVVLETNGGMKTRNDAMLPNGQGSEFELILQPLDGSQNNFYCVTNKGARLGRHSSNEIVVLEESVSRYHAQISWEPVQCRYLLKDLGSTTGTFIKVSST